MIDKSHCDIIVTEALVLRLVVSWCIESIILPNECRKTDIERVQALYDISKNNKCLNYINEVSEDISNTESKMQDIRNRIESITDELSRKIVELKVYEGYTFERIADELHYSQRYIQLKYKQCGFIGL